MRDRPVRLVDHRALVRAFALRRAIHGRMQQTLFQATKALHLVSLDFTSDAGLRDVDAEMSQRTTAEPQAAFGERSGAHAFIVSVPTSVFLLLINLMQRFFGAMISLKSDVILAILCRALL